MSPAIGNTPGCGSKTDACKRLFKVLVQTEITTCLMMQSSSTLLVGDGTRIHAAAAALRDLQQAGWQAAARLVLCCSLGCRQRLAPRHSQTRRRWQPHCCCCSHCAAAPAAAPAGRWPVAQRGQLGAASSRHWECGWEPAGANGPAEAAPGVAAREQAGAAGAPRDAATGWLPGVAAPALPGGAAGAEGTHPSALRRGGCLRCRPQRRRQARPTAVRPAAARSGAAVPAACCALLAPSAPR